MQDEVSEMCSRLLRSYVLPHTQTDRLTAADDQVLKPYFYMAVGVLLWCTLCSTRLLPHLLHQDENSSHVTAITCDRVARDSAYVINVLLQCIAWGSTCPLNVLVSTRQECCGLNPQTLSPWKSGLTPFSLPRHAVDIWSLHTQVKIRLFVSVCVSRWSRPVTLLTSLCVRLWLQIMTWS